jgi:GNAT superfamily N-acetyltransferase
VRTLDRQIAERRRENEGLRNAIDAAAKHEFPAERVAREELHLVASDDVVLLYPPGSLTAPAAGGPAAEALAVPTPRRADARDGSVVRIRLATESDRPALSELIPASARGLSRGYYSDAQTESAILHVFGTDSALIADGTYFLAEDEAEENGRLRLMGCGGWSRRRTLYGGDQMKPREDPFLDPSTEPARIRAFFVHPDCARRGVGTRILRACLDAARARGIPAGDARVDAPRRSVLQGAGIRGEGSASKCRCRTS